MEAGITIDKYYSHRDVYMLIISIFLDRLISYPINNQITNSKIISMLDFLNSDDFIIIIIKKLFGVYSDIFIKDTYNFMVTYIKNKIEHDLQKNPNKQYFSYYFLRRLYPNLISNKYNAFFRHLPINYPVPKGTIFESAISFSKFLNDKYFSCVNYGNMNDYHIYVWGDVENPGLKL